jgi:hypothetical protein
VLVPSQEKQQFKMPSDVSSWTLKSLGTPCETRGEVTVKLNDVEYGQTGNPFMEALERSREWSYTMWAAVVGGVLLVVAVIALIPIIIVLLMGGGFHEMSAFKCATAGQVGSYKAIGFSYGSNVWTKTDGNKVNVKSDMLYYYYPPGSTTCASFPTPGTEWVPLHLGSTDKPSLPSEWTLKADHLVVGTVDPINNVNTYPLSINTGDKACQLYYKVGDTASTEDNMYDDVKGSWQAIDHAGMARPDKPTCAAPP